MATALASPRRGDRRPLRPSQSHHHLRRRFARARHVGGTARNVSNSSPTNSNAPCARGSGSSNEDAARPWRRLPLTELTALVHTLLTIVNSDGPGHLVLVYFIAELQPAGPRPYGRLVTPPPKETPATYLDRRPYIDPRYWVASTHRASAIAGDRPFTSQSRPR